MKSRNVKLFGRWERAGDGVIVREGTLTESGLVDITHRAVCFFGEDLGLFCGPQWTYSVFYANWVAYRLWLVQV